MGSATFQNGSFDLIVTADHILDDAEKEEWMEAFERAANLFYNATEGQLSIGRVFLTDDSWGLHVSEIMLHSIPGRSYATYGGYGRLCHILHLFDDVKSGDGMTIVHELGHHIWGLADEYSQAVQEDAIDTNVTLSPPFGTVPIIDSTLNSVEIVSSNAILRFGDVIETRIVDTHTSNEVTIFNFWSEVPTTAAGGKIFYQIPARCRTSNSENFSIMEARDGENVTEFCTPSNHDLGTVANPSGANDTGQTARHGRSCWEVIEDVMASRFDTEVAYSDPATAGPATSPEPPVFIDLVKERRFAVVLDRSGSMGEDSKLQGAKVGAEFWIQAGVSATNPNYLIDDYLSVIWYNQQSDTPLNLTLIGNVSDLPTLVEEVNNVSHGGATNIRDAVNVAAEQITSRPGRAVIQGNVLLTDGVHNSPPNSSALEIIPDLKQAGIPVYSVAVGSPENVDLVMLETLSEETGGYAMVSPVSETGDNQPNEVTNALILLNLVLRGGPCFIDDIEFTESPPEPTLDQWLEKYRLRSDIRPLNALLTELKLKRIDELQKAFPHRVEVRKVLVEPGAERLSACAVFPEKYEVGVFLVDPNGHLVDESSPAFRRLNAEGPFDSLDIAHPTPGYWTVVLVRREPGASFTTRIQAGLENRHIAVSGGASANVKNRGVVRIWAKALWLDDLTGLDVDATVCGPGGIKHTLRLFDGTGDEPEDGMYEGHYIPQKPGRYHGVIHIHNRGQAMLAGGVHRLRHGRKLEKGQKISIKSQAKRFTRMVPFYFDVDRPEVKNDLDREKRYPIFDVFAPNLKPIKRVKKTLHQTR